MDIQYKVKDLIEVIEVEGLEYSLLGYISEDNITDPKIRALWIKARQGLIDLLKAIDPGEKYFEL